MLSVVHILPSLQMGGAERVTISLVQLQQQEGLDAQILSLGTDQDFFVKILKSSGVPVSISQSGGSRIRRLYQIYRILFAFDVIHIHSPRALIFLAPLVPLLAQRRIVYTRHGEEPLSSVTWKTLHLIMRPFINYVTCVSLAGYNVFRETHHWNPNKMAVINNGVVVQNRSSMSKSTPVRFGSVGRMIQLKGQEKLLAAVKLLSQEFEVEVNSKFTLGFYGSGPLEPELRDLASSIPPNIISFFGEVSDVEEIYNGIDVLVVTSQSEGLSMVIMEAMARSKPVIATDVGGNNNLVYDGKTGILIPYGNVEALVSAMRKLISNVDLVETLGLQARELIEEKFSLLRMHRAYLECYDSRSV